MFYKTKTDKKIAFAGMVTKIIKMSPPQKPLDKHILYAYTMLYAVTNSHMYTLWAYVASAQGTGSRVLSEVQKSVLEYTKKGDSG